MVCYCAFSGLFLLPFFLTMKTDQTVLIPRSIRVFAAHIYNIDTYSHGTALFFFFL